MLLWKEKPLTRHLERSETKSKDLNYCLVVFLKEILKELEISFLLNFKIKLITIGYRIFLISVIYVSTIH